MKNLCSILVVLITLNVSGQMKILFVDDNSINVSNSESMFASITNAGYTYTLFSVRDSMFNPGADLMSEFDLVIWYCSSDGVGNYFWNGNQTDNSELMTFLDNGGKLWVIGTDLLYNRYGSAPYYFDQTDFPYHYMGISEYDVQSYGDDGSIGVPQLDLVSVSFPFPDSILWMFSTAWWVDGCALTENASGVYKMGPQSYAFSNYYSGIYMDTDTSFSVLSFLFDPAIMDSESTRTSLIKDVLDWYASLNHIAGIALKEFKIFPNPARERIFIIQEMTSDISIYTPDGRLLKKILHIPSGSFEMNVSDLQAGLYIVIASSSGQKKVNRVIIQ